MSELKPCPFCGGEAKIKSMGHGDPYYVNCMSCGAYMHPFPKNAYCEPIAAWNTRTALSQPSVTVEEFKQSKLNADLLGLDCRAAFEKHYAGYYLKRLENGEYASEETRKLWNCWWVSWDIARPERQPKQPSVSMEALGVLRDIVTCKEVHEILSNDYPMFLEQSQAILAKYNVTVKG